MPHLIVMTKFVQLEQTLQLNNMRQLYKVQQLQNCFVLKDGWVVVINNHELKRENHNRDYHWFMVLAAQQMVGISKESLLNRIIFFPLQFIADKGFRCYSVLL